MNIDLNLLKDSAFQCACEHGFHENDKGDKHFLVLAITEIAEAIEADRKNIHADAERFERILRNSRIIQGLDESVSKETSYKVHFMECVKDSVEDEMADIVIRLLDLAGLRNIEVTLTDENLTIVRDSFFSNYGFTTISYHLIEILYQGGQNSNLHDVICSAISFIYLWSKYLKFDLYQHINWKMEYNELRPKYNVDILSHLKG